MHKVDREPGEVVLQLEQVSAGEQRTCPRSKTWTYACAPERFGNRGRGRQWAERAGGRVTGLRVRRHDLADGKDIANKPPQVSIGGGLAHIPEDRIGVGSALNLSITKNVIMKNFESEPISHRWQVNYTEAGRHAAELKQSMTFGAIGRNPGA